MPVQEEVFESMEQHGLPEHRKSGATIRNDTPISETKLPLSLKPSLLFECESGTITAQQDSSRRLRSNLDSNYLHYPRVVVQYVKGFLEAASIDIQLVHTPTLFFKRNPTLNFNLDEHQYHERCAVFFGLAAIGAYYEMDVAGSMLLVRATMQIIDQVLERHRRTRVSAALDSIMGNYSAVTPISLAVVQAMILVVMYGALCSETTVLARTESYSIALLSLGRDAGTNEAKSELARSDLTSYDLNGGTFRIYNMEKQGVNQENLPDTNVEDTWFTWKLNMERQRCLTSIQWLCAPGVQRPSWPELYGSRRDGDLDRTLWAAETASEWKRIGGAKVTTK